jgi:hypothetical protein
MASPEPPSSNDFALTMPPLDAAQRQVRFVWPKQGA